MKLGVKEKEWLRDAFDYDGIVSIDKGMGEWKRVVDRLIEKGLVELYGSKDCYGHVVLVSFRVTSEGEGVMHNILHDD